MRTTIAKDSHSNYATVHPSRLLSMCKQHKYTQVLQQQKTGFRHTPEYTFQTICITQCPTWVLESQSCFTLSQQQACRAMAFYMLSLTPHAWMSPSLFISHGLGGHVALCINACQFPRADVHAKTCAPAACCACKTLYQR